MFKFIQEECPDACVTEEYINKVEEELDIQFPEVLRNYYLKHNGAEINECRFEKYGVEFCVVLIPALGYGTMAVEKIFKYNATNDAVPSTFIPLAVDEDEDDYYWNSEDGKVYYLSFSNVEHPKVICDSVEEFFRILNNC